MVDVDLDRFVRAHRENYRQALAELRQGKASLEDAYVALIGEDAP